MFGFFRRSAPRLLTDAIRQAIVKDGAAPTVSDPSRLRMVEMAGRYSNRKVTYFRVFDPGSAAQQTVEIRHYKDFDLFPALVLHSGHLEQDGTVVLTRPITMLPSEPMVRTRAGRIVAAPAPTVATDEAVAASAPVTDAPSGATRA